MTPIDHAIDALKAFDVEPKPIDRMLAAYLRRHRDISSAGRRLIYEIVFGVMRWRRRLDGWLMLRGVARPDHRQRAICYLVWRRPHEATMVSYDAQAASLGIPSGFDEKMPKNFPGGVSAFNSFPDFLYQKLVDSYGADGAASMASRLNEPSCPALRVNQLRADRDKVQRLLSGEGIEATPTQRSPFGLRLDRRVAVDSIGAYRDGLIEIQDEASQLATIVAGPRPGDAVLDICAGAGGKTLMLAMLMQDEGRIVASDADAIRLRELRRRCKRAGVKCVEAIGKDALMRRKSRVRGFDMVFIDAPCSGTGTLRRCPDLKWRLDEAMIEGWVSVQRELLEEALEFARPGGRLVYVTCSILPEENELMVANFLRRHPCSIADPAHVLESMGIPTDGVCADGPYLKTDPRFGSWDGFFAAILKV